MPQELISGSIVAVHGMNLENKLGHAENAWTDKGTGVNWLHDLLPLRITEARILAFRYNANILKGASIAGVHEQAKNLLNGLLAQREVNQYHNFHCFLRRRKLI